MRTAPEPRQRVDVCIVGAGPAGNAMAIRLAQLGHDICLIERSAFPRPHIGESLSPGVWHQFDMLGVRPAVAAEGFSPCQTSLVHWEGGAVIRRDLGTPGGLLVDRERFDAILFEGARSHGVRVMKPATLRTRTVHADGWHLDIESFEGRKVLDARFLVDASGRSAVLRGSKQRAGPRTLALYGYWRGGDLPHEPRIESALDAWYWGVPLPNGSYNAMVFVDADDLRARRTHSLSAIYRALIGRSGLLAKCRDAYLLENVRAADATPYLDRDSVSPYSIKVGEAALALDPLSSTGVQKAIGTALTGAIVVNTLLRCPAQTEAACQFYSRDLAEASKRHRRWAATQYAVASTAQASRFWKARAAGAGPETEAAEPPADINRDLSPEMPVVLSPETAFVNEPCIVGDLITLQPALRHPGLERPVAFLGGWRVAALLQPVRPGIALGELMNAWRIQPARSLRSPPGFSTVAS